MRQNLKLYDGLVVFFGYSCDLLIFIFSFLCVYVLKRQLLPGDILFYEGLLLIIFFVPIYLAAKRFLRFKVDVRDLFVYAAVAYCFLITVPTLLERSISLIVIGSLSSEYQGGLTVNEINQIFISQYVNGDSQVRKRLAEQIANGNIKFVSGKYFLTSQGYMYSKLNIEMANIFNIDQQYVNPKISK